MSYRELKFDRDSVFLVTGGAGFIGSNLVEAILKMGYKVRVLDNFSTGKRENIENLFFNERFELIEGDIRDFEICMKACQGVSYILHQAAWGSVPRSIKMPLLYEEINVKGTLNLLESARLNSVKKFVYASSSSVYGDSIELPKIEGREGKILSPYALTKKICEEYGRLFYKLYGLETIGMRYFNVFGPKQNPEGVYAAVIPKFINELLSNKRPVINGDGENSRDFTYIENVIEFNLKACLAPIEASGEVFNVACGDQISLNNLLKKLSSELNVKLEPIFNSEREGDIKHSNADISKSKKIIGYSPEFNFDKGIKETMKWYKKLLNV